MAPTFVFNSVSLSALSNTKTYYLQMVNVTPSPAFNTVANLISTLVSTPQVLTGTSYTGGMLNFTDQTFNTRTYTSTHVGFVIAEQIAGSPSTTDPLIAYSPHTNALGQEITMPVGSYAVLLDFAVTSGLFSVVAAWQYSVGGYVNNGATYANNGLIQLIGTKNSTTVFNNPCTASPIQIDTLGNTGNSFPVIFNRLGGVSIGGFGNPVYAGMFRFRNSADISFNSGGKIKWEGVNPQAKLYGSNLLVSGWTTVSLLNDDNWTELVDFGNTGLTASFTSNGTFYKYLRIKQNYSYADNSFFISNVEFYNCTIRTPNQNFN